MQVMNTFLCQSLREFNEILSPYVIKLIGYLVQIAFASH